MSERWLRWYDGTVRDGKFRLVAELSSVPVCTVIGVWASLLEDAATSEPRGVAEKGIEFHSLWLGIADYEVGTVWNAMERVGLIVRNGDEIRILNWSRRQFENDSKDPTAKERKRRWKQRHISNGTERNAQERSGTPESESESESDKKKERVRAVANAMSTSESEGAFEEFKRAYPKRKGAMGWQLAKRHFLKAIKAGENPQAIIAGARGYAAAEAENVGTRFIKQASAWMNQECWKDYAETARKPQNTLSYEELKAQWLAKQGKANAERTELGTTASMVEAEPGDCELSRDLGGNQTRVPRIQRMDEVLSRRNGANSTLHEASEDNEQGSDASEPMAEPDRNAADEAENGVEVNSER